MIRLSVGLESARRHPLGHRPGAGEGDHDDALRSAIPWPWAGSSSRSRCSGRKSCCAGSAPSPSLGADRCTGSRVMALGVASLALMLLPPRRVAYLLGFLVCAALMGWALWLQYGDGPRALPAVHVPARRRDRDRRRVPRRRSSTIRGRAARRSMPVLTLITAGAGAALAARQVWLQALPKDQVPACGMGLSYMLDTLPFTRRDHAGARGQRRMRRKRLGVPRPGDSGVDARVLRRDDRRRVRADPPRLTCSRVDVTPTSAPSGSRRPDGSPRRSASGCG